jgi:hypothetical protein
MDLREKWEDLGMDLIDLAENMTLMNAAMNILVP